MSIVRSLAALIISFIERPEGAFYKRRAKPLFIFCVGAFINPFRRIRPRMAATRGLLVSTGGRFGPPDVAFITGPLISLEAGVSCEGFLRNGVSSAGLAGPSADLAYRFRKGGSSGDRDDPCRVKPSFGPRFGHRSSFPRAFEGVSCISRVQPITRGRRLASASGAIRANGSASG